jgi:hypothetical protein
MGLLYLSLPPKLTFSDQAEVRLQLQVREGHMFVFSCISMKVLCKDLYSGLPLLGAPKKFFTRPQNALGMPA